MNVTLTVKNQSATLTIERKLSQFLGTPEFERLSYYRRKKLTEGYTPERYDPTVATVWVELSKNNITVTSTSFFDRLTTADIIRSFFPVTISFPIQQLRNKSHRALSQTSVRDNIRYVTCHPDKRRQWQAVEPTFHVKLKAGQVIDGLTVKQPLHLGIFPESEVKALDRTRYELKRVKTLEADLLDREPDVEKGNKWLGVKGWSLEDLWDDSKVQAELDRQAGIVRESLESLGFTANNLDKFLTIS